MAGHLMTGDAYRRNGISGTASQVIRRPARSAHSSPVPVQAYNAFDLTDPALIEFLRDGRVTGDGVAVNEAMALRNSTFFRAGNLIAGSIGMLPIHLMERTEGGEARKAREHPLFKVLHSKPNDYQTPLEFKSYMQTCALLDGNAYAMPIRSRGRVIALVPLKRRSVTPFLTDEFQLRFRYRRPSGGTVTLGPQDIFHFRHPVSVDGLKGVSLLDVAANSLGLASQAEKAISRLFSGGVMAGGALETEQDLGEEAIESLKKSLAEQHSGSDGAGSWMLLESGLKANPFVAPKDSQNHETRKFQAEEMSRFTGVPRPLLMFDETSWGSGIEQLGRFFVMYCLLQWFVAWEQAISRTLLTDAEQDRYFAKFNAGALERGSPKEQAEFFARALGSGGGAAWMTPNEVRETLDMSSHPDGDTLPSRATGSAQPEPKDDPEPSPPDPKRKK